MNIIDKVREVNPEAADFLETQIDNPSYNFNETRLHNIMTFKDTPQGFDYWDDICEQIGDW